MKPIFIVAILLSLVASQGVVSSAEAQSGSRGYGRYRRRSTPRYRRSYTPTRRSTSRYTPRRNSTTSRSARRIPTRGLSGYCPVCILKLEKWVKGDYRIKATYDNVEYLFPSEKTRREFLAEPTQYVPALNGNDIVTFAKTGKRVGGSVYHAAIHRGRLYLFTSKETQAAFAENRSRFREVDLAFNGNCAVCLHKLRKRVAGKPEFTAIHNGFRYRFPSNRERVEFVKNPVKYADPAARLKSAN